MGTDKLTEEGSPREQQRRKTILRAAVEVFATKGYHGCRIADVAQEAGVAYGLVYHYFKNKEELLQSVFEVAWSGFVTRMREVAETEGTLESQVRGVCEVAFDAYQVDPRGVRVVILEIARSPVAAGVNRQSAFSEVIRISESMFIRAQTRGEIRADLDPRLCAAMLFGAVEMGLTSLVLGFINAADPASLDRAKTQLADSMLHGVLAPRGDTVLQGNVSRSIDSGST